MTHYDITEWTDFVRGLVNPARREAMESHLASGCAACARTRGLLDKFAAAAAHEAAYEVPEHALHSARSLFALQRQPEKVSGLPRLLARLVYDSFREPLPAGVRATQLVARQALYEAGQYCVDLRLERERGSPRITMVGQIADRALPNKPLAEIPVVLMSGKEVVAHAVSSTFGEFQMDFRPQKHLCLYVPVGEEGKRIEVRLNELIP